MTHDELVDIGRRWLVNPFHSGSPFGHYGCSIVLTEIVTAGSTSEVPDVLGFENRGSILIECKTSISDFRADAKKPFRHKNGLGRQRWFLAPEEIIPHEEIPPGWGLLEVGKRQKIILVRQSSLWESFYQGERDILLSTLRRLKIEPEGHTSIKVYTIATKNKATLTICEKDQA